MTRVHQLLSASALCVALAGCATKAPDVADLKELPDLADLSAPTVPEKASAQLTIDTPVGRICEDPRGRAVLDKNLPNLRKNPNYFLFKGMSLRQLAGMSKGKITDGTLEQVRLELASAPSASGAP